MEHDQGIARTQSPTNKNYAAKLPTFVVIVGVSQFEVQWISLTLGEPPWWSWLTPQPGKYAELSNWHKVSTFWIDYFWRKSNEDVQKRQRGFINCRRSASAISVKVVLNFANIFLWNILPQWLWFGLLEECQVSSLERGWTFLNVRLECWSELVGQLCAMIE